MNVGSPTSLVRYDWAKYLRTFGSALIFAGCLALLFQSWELAWMVTFGLGVHELGHVLVVSWLGIDWEVGFGPLGAWTRTPLKERQALGHFANALIHLAGPFSNLLCALVAYAVHTLWFQNAGSSNWLRVANFNALIGLLNALPMGRLSDGGKFAQRLFESLEEGAERKLVLALVTWPLSILWIMSVTRRALAPLFSVLLLGVWFVAHMLLEHTRDEPAAAGSPKAMTYWQAVILLFATVNIILLCSVIVLQTPFWLTREHFMNLVQRVDAVFSLLR